MLILNFYACGEYGSKTYLNTSYVDIKHLKLLFFYALVDLNTSYVDIKPIKANKTFTLKATFKYILC